MFSLLLPILLSCISSRDDVAAVLLLGIVAELVVGKLLVVIAVTVVALFIVTSSIDRS